MDKLYKKQKEELKKSVNLRQLAIDKSISKEKSDEIRKKQDEAFKKYNFIKDFRKAVNKIEKSDNNG